MISVLNLTQTQLIHSLEHTHRESMCVYVCVSDHDDLLVNTRLSMYSDDTEDSLTTINQ